MSEEIRPDSQAKADPEPEKNSSSFWDIVRFALIAAIIVIPIRMWVAQPFVVSGSSMVPTFENGEYLIVDEISYNLGEPKRNDVVVFKYPKDPKKYFIKRIIGLPNETVDIKAGRVMIINEEHPEGFVLEEPYVENQAKSVSHVMLGDDEYFVMGDNRPASSDSRYWGAVPRELLIGRALVRLLPINKVDFLPGQFKQNGEN